MHAYDLRNCAPTRAEAQNYALGNPCDVNVNVNVNKQYLSTATRKSCNKGYDSCAMRVVFSKPQNCPGFNNGDFRDGGSAFQHMGPETAKAREPNVTVLIRGKSRSPWVAARR